MYFADGGLGSPVLTPAMCATAELSLQLSQYLLCDRWATGLGEVVAFGIEGIGSYGAGLARYLAGRGRTVIEVSRPDRSTRRRLGKSDPVDAEMAARAVLAGVAKDSPKSGLDEVEMIRMLKIVKDSAIKARTQAISQMKALIVTAPVELRHKLPVEQDCRTRQDVEWPADASSETRVKRWAGLVHPYDE